MLEIKREDCLKGYNLKCEAPTCNKPAMLYFYVGLEQNDYGVEIHTCFLHSEKKQVFEIYDCICKNGG